jgi:hypothetical protein
MHLCDERVGVIEGDVGALEAAGSLHPDLTGAVHHDVGDVRIAQQRLGRPEPGQSVGELANEAGERVRRQQHPLVAHRPRDGRAQVRHVRRAGGAARELGVLGDPTPDPL